MKALRLLCVAAVAGLILPPGARAQEQPKPGPEHEVLKKLEGTWDATMKMMGMESKGTMVWKMDLGGLWLSSSFEGEFGGAKFYGKGFDSYDGTKKKYTSVWVDSMSGSPMTMEGTFDKDTKTLTMAGEGPGPDGKPMKFKMVSEMKDDDNILSKMTMGEGGAAMSFEIVYKRKK
jgi:Protein of unknown function (DUF1579)